MCGAHAHDSDITVNLDSDGAHRIRRRGRYTMLPRVQNCSGEERQERDGAAVPRRNNRVARPS